jgi:L-lactate dehydrogenase (cytochrome)
MIISSPHDFREAARRRLPPFLFDYIDGGALDEQTLEFNHQDLRSVRLRQQVLRDVSVIETGVDLFGTWLTMPVILGPVGLSGMYARRGEVQAAEAAAAAGIPFSLSTVSICSIEEVAATGSPPWFQLYVMRDRMFMLDLLQAARASRCPALIFTVDMAVPGIRRRDAKSGLAGPRAAVRRYAQALSRPRWTWDVGVRGRPHLLGNLRPVLEHASGLEDFMGWLGTNFDPAITWRDIGWIREHWDGPLIIKGILTAEDAREAARAGADAIVVSNHGGRQLDGVTSTAAALPRVADAVGADLKVLVDSGVRSGLDVVRMLALGAQAVMLGRAWAFALAAAGRAGVEMLLRMIHDEMRVAMALTGCTSIGAIDRSILEAAECASRATGGVARR